MLIINIIAIIFVAFLFLNNDGSTGKVKRTAQAKCVSMLSLEIVTTHYYMECLNNYYFMVEK